MEESRRAQLAKRGKARSGKSARGESARNAARDGAARTGAGRGAPGAWATFLGFALLGLLLYAPVLDGEFVSDDSHYVLRNEYVHSLTLDNLIAIWNPTSEVTVLVENYAPVHLMLHALEWQLFGPSVVGYHVVNVLLHALAAVLLIPLFRRSGMPEWTALLAATFFFVHPAQVESVAWISQLKSSSALVLSLLALRLHPARPLWALLLFALALFAKPFSAFALPVLALTGWLRARPGSPEAPTFGWPWLGAWVVVVGLFALVESSAFSQSAGLAPPLYEDLTTRFLTVFSVVWRYLVMAISGTGMSAFHEPPPVLSPLDPHFLAGLAVVAGLGYRAVRRLLAGREESIWWFWAAISFAPLSGVIPLPYPMADRYLYFVLPGLIGGSVLAWRDSVWPWLDRRLSGEVAPLVRRAVVGAVLGLTAWMAIQSTLRAPVYRSADRLMADAERHYPDGVAAHTRNAGRDASMGNVVSAIAHLEAAHARGYNRVDHLIGDPRYASLRAHPRFIALQQAMADDWIVRLSADPEPTHYKARALAQAYIAKGELEQALEIISLAAERPGPIGEGLRADAEQLRQQVRLEKRLEAERARGGPRRP